MPKLSFQAYVEGSRLVAVTYPYEGGDAVIRESWNLQSLNLSATEETPIHHEVTAGQIAGSEKTSLQIEIRYQDKQLKVTPVNRQENPIKTRAILYDFKDLGLTFSDDIRPSEKSRKLTARRDKPELNKDEDVTSLF